jgi:hypothetical protein
MKSINVLEKMLESYDLEELGSGARGFDPATLSQVAEGIYVTAEDGVASAREEGCYVINVAEEVDSNSDLKIAIKPYSRNIRTRLDEVADRMDKILSQPNGKVAVHCRMGMERSVLSVVWYLSSITGMTTDAAYAQVKARRPIALDQREWAGLD